MTARKPVTKNMRVRVFLRDGGRCHLCGLKIDTAKHSWHMEHRVPLWRNGADDESNMAPAHVDCHASKSADEAPQRAKSDRIRARHLGVKKSRTMTRWRNMRGEIVTAPRER